ncbi:hypothetical protein NQ315_002902 [Exocentrus adspersus]|uniref:LAGLIDADG homing endonuclease n=1 Tax=Exocentrus adspersus TaxID=1586481 RepID=A0AAV8V6N9_9CUCU|nr:hypothetical protein NQ315_002902 [Exocentrus adspersus]
MLTTKKITFLPRERILCRKVHIITIAATAISDFYGTSVKIEQHEQGRHFPRMGVGNWDCEIDNFGHTIRVAIKLFEDFRYLATPRVFYKRSVPTKYLLRCACHGYLTIHHKIEGEKENLTRILSVYYVHSKAL